MKVLLTGASGFLGTTIKKRLVEDEVITLGRNNGDSIIADLCESVPDLPKADLIIHSAGKAHSVPKTEAEKRDFFNVNVNGTKRMLDSISRDCIPKSFIFISTVAVYGRQNGVLINESTPLNATDPYGLSKIDAENIVKEWCERNSIICTILRLPLIAGQNPPGNLGAMISAIGKGYYFDIDGGSAKKSIVMAEDVANIIPTAALIGGIYNLTDRYHPSFSELSNMIASQSGKSKPYNIPYWIANIMAKSGDLLGSRAALNSKKLEKIISDLTFDDNKAFQSINWRPKPVLEVFKIK